MESIWISGEEEVPLQPLARIDDPTDRMKLQVLLEDWLALGNVKLLPAQSKALYRALLLLAEAPAGAAHHHQSHHPGAGCRGAGRAQPLLAGGTARALSRRRS